MNPLRLLLTGIVFFILNHSTSAQISDARDNDFFINNEEVKKTIDDIAKLINENKVSVSRLGSDGAYHAWGSEKNIKVHDDRIEISGSAENFRISFYDIIKKLSYTSSRKKVTGVYIGDFMLSIAGTGNTERLRDHLNNLQAQHIKYVNQDQVNKIKEQESELVLFEPVAAGYRALKVKPPVSEEQRKYIVQANSFNQKKEYTKAIELYQKAIEIDQTAYPAAYSNMALLSAQIHKFEDAIFYMKKYLMLEPEAPDSRGGRDKIYEWEAELAKD